MAINALCQLVVMAVAARYLTAEQFGIVAATNIVIMLVQMLTEVGAGSVLIQRSNINDRIIAAVTHISLLIGLAFALLIVGISPYIAKYFHLPELSEYINVLAVSFVLVALYKIPESILQRNMRFKLLMKANLFTYVAGYALPAILLIVKGYGIWAIVFASLGQIALKALLFSFIQPSRFFCRPQWSEYREVIRFGLGVTSIRVWNYFYQQGDKFVLGRTVGSSGLGQYHLGSQLAFLPGQYVGDILNAVLFPVLSRLRGQRIAIGAMIMAVQELAFYGMNCMGMFMAICGNEIIGLIYGDRWLSVVLVFQTLCLGAGVRSATRIGDIANRAQGRLKAASISKLVAALFLVTAVYFSSRLGLHCVAFAVLASNIFAWFLVSWVSMRGLNISRATISAALSRVVISSILAGLLIKSLHLVSLIWFEDSVIRMITVAPIAVVVVFIVGYVVYRRSLINLKQSIFG